MESKILNLEKDIAQVLQESHFGIKKIDSTGYSFNFCQNGHPLSSLTTDKDLVQPFILVGRQYEVNQNESQDTSSESLEGSPLKLQQILKEKDEKTVADLPIKPLSLQQARLLLSKICLKSPDLSPYSLWLLCHGKQHNSQILYMGIQPRMQNNQNLITSHKISMEGSYSQHSKYPSLQSYLKENCHIDSIKCESEYDIFSSNDKDGADQCSLLIQYCWAHATSLMQSPPHSAKASLNVNIGIGNSGSPVYDIFKELDMLKSLAKGIKDGCIEYSVEKNHIPVMDRVKQLVEETLDGIPARKLPNSETESSPGKSLRARYSEREDLDFTEQLWIILKSCKSSSELKSCLQYVLQLIKAGTLQPRVHRSNQSSLAILIRESYNNCMVMPIVDDIQALTYLVDIGIDKIRRTYEDIFKGKELVTAGHLDYYVQSVCNIDEKLERTEKLHYTLELMAMLEKSIAPPTQVLGSAVRQALKYYESKSVTEDHTFCIQVNVEHVIDITGRLPVLTWKAETRHKEHGNDVTNIFCITPQALYGHAEVEVPKESSNENDYTYYLTIYKETIIGL